MDGKGNCEQEVDVAGESEGQPEVRVEGEEDCTNDVHVKGKGETGVDAKWRVGQKKRKKR